MAEVESEASGGESSLVQTMKTKLGPLPLWAWAGIGLLVALYIHSKNADTATSTDNSLDNVSDSQVPDFINQVYVQPLPPVADPPKLHIDPVIPKTPPGGTPHKGPTPEQVAANIAAHTPTMAAVNQNRTNHHLNPFSHLQYAQHYGTAASKANAIKHRPTFAAVNKNRADHKVAPLTQAQYKAQYE